MLSMAIVHLFAVMSPGANFLIVARNSLTYSRRNGVLTARGVALGSLIYIIVGMLGFATVISQSPTIYNAIKLLGAGYFLYIGFKSLASLRKRSTLETRVEKQPHIGERRVFFSGLITALSNATSALYFLALFTTFVEVSATWQEKVLTGLVLISISFTWYNILALTFSQSRVRSFYHRFERWLTGLIGFLWLFLAFRLVAA